MSAYVKHVIVWVALSNIKQRFRAEIRNYTTPKNWLHQKKVITATGTINTQPVKLTREKLKSKERKWLFNGLALLSKI